jgi:hypothetical protein
MIQSNELREHGGIKLYAGTASGDLAQKVADYLGENLCGRDIVEFPNENLFVKLHSSVRGQDVYVIQHTASPVHRNLMELPPASQPLFPTCAMADQIKKTSRVSPLHPA